MAKDMKAALTRSVETEKASVQNRFERAELILGTRSRAGHTPEKGRVPVPKKVPSRPKIVRDTFTIPEGDYALIAKVKKDCMKAGVEANKSEIVRAGLKLLAGMNQTELKDALGAVERLMPGRPKAEK